MQIRVQQLGALGSRLPRGLGEPWPPLCPGRVRPGRGVVSPILSFFRGWVGSSSLATLPGGWGQHSRSTAGSLKIQEGLLVPQPRPASQLSVQASPTQDHAVPGPCAPHQPGHLGPEVCAGHSALWGHRTPALGRSSPFHSQTWNQALPHELPRPWRQSRRGQRKEGQHTSPACLTGPEPGRLGEVTPRGELTHCDGSPGRLGRTLAFHLALSTWPRGHPEGRPWKASGEAGRVLEGGGSKGKGCFVGLWRLWPVPAFNFPSVRL